jgi:hypothetical protein
MSFHAALAFADRCTASGLAYLLGKPVYPAEPTNGNSVDDGQLLEVLNQQQLVDAEFTTM